MDMDEAQAKFHERDARLQEGHARLQEQLVALGGLVRDLALAQARTEERVHELAMLQKEQAMLQKEQAESLNQTRENLNALIRVVDDIVRRNGKR